MTKVDLDTIRFSAGSHNEADGAGCVMEWAFNFSIDVAASAHNTKLPRFYSIEDDGLMQSWSGERVWCNPPYSNIRPWLEKAWEEADKADLIVMLLPANRTEQGWWQECVEPLRRAAVGDFLVEFLPGRVRFIAPGADGIGPNERPPFGCCLLIWQAVATPDSQETK